MTLLSRLKDVIKAFLMGPEAPIDRAQFLVEEALKGYVSRKVHLSSRNYHAENITIEFLIEYLSKSNPYRPKQGEWLRDWDRRPAIPTGIKRIRDSAYKAIQSRLQNLQQLKRDEELAKGRLRAQEIITKHSSRIDKFFEIAYRKVAAPDDYGDENPNALDQEIRRLLNKIAETETEVKRGLMGDKGKGPLGYWLTHAPVTGLIAEELRSRSHAYYQARKAKPTAATLNKMSGIDFEVYICELLRLVGVEDVSTTPATGDQGGDLLFTANGRKYVVQAKRYSGPVGNKAIQEVHAAKGYYGCDVAWVVSNTRYTSSAIALAKQLQVVLVDGESLADFDAFAKRALGPISIGAVRVPSITTSGRVLEP